MCSIQVSTSSNELVTTRDEQVCRHREVDDRLKKALRHTREMVICFKKISVINDLAGTANTDTLAFVPSTLMQVMTLERFVCFTHVLNCTLSALLLSLSFLFLFFVVIDRFQSIACVA